MKVPYTFSIIRYVHDSIAGESLNVGVLLYSPAASFLDVKLDLRYERFSNTFSRFDGGRFKQVLQHFESAVAEASDKLSEPVLLVRDSAGFTTASDLAKRIWPDQGLSFRFSETMAGIGENLPSLLHELFDRFVTSQYERQETERSDEQVWSRYRERLGSEITRNLRSKTFETADYKIDFEHAFQNERWHILQPLTMDYAKASNIQDKATKWLGVAINLKESPEAVKGKFYFLLYPPEQAAHQAAYQRAKNILNKMPLEHEIFEEDEAPRLSEELLSHMKHS